MTVIPRNKLPPDLWAPAESHSPQVPMPQSHPSLLPSSVQRVVPIWKPKSCHLTDARKMVITLR